MATRAGKQSPNNHMVKDFDIFLGVDNEEHIWVESAGSLEEAEARVRELALTRPGKYLVIGHKTGDRVVIALD
jgi:hypothetical protein